MTARLILFVQETFHQIIGFQKAHTVDDFQKTLEIIIIILSTPHIHPKPMPFNQKILGAIGEMLIIGKLMRSIVVLKDMAMHMGKYLARHSESDTHFNQQVLDWQESVKTHTECRIFCLGSGESDLGMQLHLPEEWNITVSDQEGSTRFSSSCTGVRITIVQTGLVGITPHLQVEFAHWFDDHSLVSSTFQVAKDHLQCSRMRLFGVVLVESGDLTHGK